MFALMALDALLPVGGELIMLYAGVIAASALGYVELATAGALIGWGIGRWGGRPLVERHGRWLHLSPRALERAEHWFERRGRWAVLLGRITPLVRSFISVPAGLFEVPLPIYVPLTLLGSAIWCFAFAAAGWALGGSWESFHENFRYADYAVIALALAGGSFLVIRRLRPAD